tara:strand:+ start:2523 stop:2906 length:384 start_codon:yes stop_codon:yes gene_type:complete
MEYKENGSFPGWWPHMLVSALLEPRVDMNVDNPSMITERRIMRLVLLPISFSKILLATKGEEILDFKGNSLRIHKTRTTADDTFKKTVFGTSKREYKSCAIKLDSEISSNGINRATINQLDSKQRVK